MQLLPLMLCPEIELLHAHGADMNASWWQEDLAEP